MTKREEKDIVLDHDYDGIRELDNKLPPWWLYLFYITIVWSVLYLIYFHVLDIGDSSYVEYMKEIDPNWTEPKTEASIGMGYRSPFYNPQGDATPLSRMEESIAKKESAKLEGQYALEQGDLDEKLGVLSFEELILAAMRVATPEQMEKLQNNFPDIWQKYNTLSKEGAVAAVAATDTGQVKEEFAIEPLTDEASLRAGKQIFIANCVTCHGQLGEGGIGPNLTDNYFLHGAGMGNTVKTIVQGIPAKGMISWRGILKEDQIKQVASYILTLKGTNPPNAKAPQGEKVTFE